MIGIYWNIFYCHLGGKKLIAFFVVHFFIKAMNQMDQMAGGLLPIEQYGSHPPGVIAAVTPQPIGTNVRGCGMEF